MPHGFSADIEKKPLSFRYVRSVLGNFVHYYRPHLKLFCLSTSCALARALFTTLVPLLVYAAFETYLPAKNFPMIWCVIAGMVILIALTAVSSYVNIRYGHILGVRMEAEMRNDLFTHLQKLSFSYFDKTKTGHIMSRITNDLTMIAELAHHGPEDLLSILLLIIGGFVVMFSLNPLLALITAFPLPLIILWSALFQGKMRTGFQEARRKVADLNSQVENSVLGIREVKSFNNEEYEIGRFQQVNSRYRHVREQVFYALALFHAGIMSLIQSYSLLFIAAGVVLVYYGRATVVEVMTFFMYSKYITMPIRRMADLIEQFQMGLAAYERFYEILQIEPEIADRPDAAAKTFQGRIEFDNVSFGYNRADGEVLHHINLVIAPGRTIALVGESGAGKTTLAALIPRFYEIDSGAIKIDGRDIRDYTLRNLRANIGTVRQTPFLFDSTIRENILFGRMDADEAELIAAAKEANIYDFIHRLPDGFDTLTGEQGVRLSGGQKQRIAIARVFLKNPAILIFDEATSSLDNESESLVQEAMDQLCHDRTTIIIAHRLSTIKHADEIYCLRRGRIVEHGPHPELLARNGYYKQLYEMHSF